MRSLLCLFTVLAMTSLATAAVPEPHGKHFLLSTPPADVVVPEVTADDAAAEARLRARAEREELQGGPYAPLLAETLGDLARLLDRRGDYDAALALRERALHLTRINEGLYSRAQGPLVRGILDALRARGDYPGLDGRYAYFFRLYGSGQPPFTAPRWAALMEYLGWQREALLRGLDGDPRRRLLDLYALNEDVIKELLDERPVAWERLHDAAMSQLATLYLIEDRIQPVEVFGQPRIERIRREDPREPDLLRERLEALQRTAAGRGRDLLETAIEAVPAAEVRPRLTLRLALADWQLWQGATREARDAYEALWRDGVAVGLEPEVGSWLAHPVPLPAGDIFTVPGAGTSAPVPLTLDVAANGRVRVIAVHVDEERARDANRLGRYLRSARFRPALRDGLVADSAELRADWVLVED